MPEPQILDEDRVGDLDELPAWPRVLAVDPGLHTGWAVLWFDPDVVFDTSRPIATAHVAWQCGMLLGDENSILDHLVRIGAAVGIGGEGLAVVHETFRVRRIAFEESFLSPARISAAHKWALHRGVRDRSDMVVRRRKVHWQEAVDAKSVANDNRLRLWQMYMPGPDHPRDATRHAVLWVRMLRSRGEDFYDRAHFVDVEEKQETLLQRAVVAPV